MTRKSLRDDPSRAPARAMLRGAGFTGEDLSRPLVAVFNTWAEITPCNVHLRLLAEHVKRGIRAAGGTPVELNGIAVSDGITMGTEGMRASLASREVIADSVELAVGAHDFEAAVGLVGCDKTIPGTLMGLLRLDLPSLVLYGGSIAPGRFRGRDVTVQDVFEAVGAVAAGDMSEDDLGELERAACPGAGACGGQFTANTMATALTFLGVSPFGSNELPATHKGKAAAAFAVGEQVMAVLEANRRPSDFLTIRSLENAAALGSHLRGGPDRIDPRATVADGLRVREAGRITRTLCRDGLDGVVMVTEDEVRDTMVSLAAEEHLVVEGAGAVSVAGLSRLSGHRRVAVVSGGNVDLDVLADLVRERRPSLRS